MSEFDQLVSAMPYFRRLEEACSMVLQAIATSPLWSPNNPTGRRIPWRQAKMARAFVGEELDWPGLYAFGAAGDAAGPIPRYVGMTTRALWKRLSGRYVIGKNCQCELAARYETTLRDKGVGGFPPEVVQWFRRRRLGTIRLQGAVDFARHGIDGIWFGLVPSFGNSAVDRLTLEALEQGLKRAGDRWNQERGYPPLINKL